MNRHELSLKKHTTNRQKKPLKQLNDTQRYKSYDPEKEPLKVSDHPIDRWFSTNLSTKAYLRIRPKSESHQGQTETPYIDVLDNFEVVMTPPEVNY